MKAQELVDLFEATKLKVKLLHEEQDEAVKKFMESHSINLEYPVTVDEKPKFMRLYKPDGRFVYYSELDIGVRATAKNEVGTE